MTPLIANDQVAVAAEDNPDLAELVSQHDEVVQPFEKLNSTIVEYKLPRRVTQQTKAEIHEYRRQADALQRDMLDWEERARGFIEHPSLIYRHSGATELQLRNEQKTTCNLLSRTQPSTCSFKPG